MKKVSDILARKGSHIISILPNATVLEALKIMADQNIGSVMVMEGNVFLGCFQSEVSGYTQALLLRKECITVAGRFQEHQTFTDFEFIISLAYHFNAVILYEPLVFRRIHQTNYIHSNWKQSMDEGIEIIRKHRSMISKEIANNSLFRLHIDYGEKYLELRQYWNAIKQFNKAWLNKPLTIIPAKKITKSLWKLLKGS